MPRSVRQRQDSLLWMDRIILLRLEDMEGYKEMEKRVMKERADG